jgi:hypothetical protein
MGWRHGERREITHVAGDDVPAAERYLADVDVLDQLLQVIPWSAESGEAPHVGCVITAESR